MGNNEYSLSDQERASLQSLNTQALAAKLAVYQLNEQLEAARAEVKATEARWNGALQMLANANGMQSAQLAPDHSKITRT